MLFDLLKERIPHILFLDIHMPCKDGVACILEIRRNRAYDKLPVIMYTSQTSPRIIEETYRNGANLYLSKTLTIIELVQKLKKVFSLDWENSLHFPSQSDYVVN